MSSSPPASASLLPALRSNAWFGACSAPFQQALVDGAHVRHLSAGQALFERGEEAEGLCCVTAGALLAGAVHEDGARSLLAHLEPYQWFGEVSMLDGLPRVSHHAAASAKAIQAGVSVQPASGNGVRASSTPTANTIIGMPMKWVAMLRRSRW